MEKNPNETPKPKVKAESNPDLKPKLEVEPEFEIEYELEAEPELEVGPGFEAKLEFDGTPEFEAVQRPQDMPTMADENSSHTDTPRSSQIVGVPSTKILLNKEEYRILGILGRGGMGSVYKAWDKKNTRTVAIKVLNIYSYATTDSCTPSRDQLRFEREFNIVSSLHHENIVEAYNYGILNDGRPYFVMEYLEGTTLANLLSQRGALDSKEVVSILKKLVSPCCYYWGLKYVHRDLKPANIFKLGDSRIKIADFGLAALQEQIGILTNHAVVGTFAYLPPEMWESNNNIDWRADLYSLGATAYQLLTNELPFGQTQLMKMLTERPKKPSSIIPTIPKKLDDFVMNCLEKNPDTRAKTFEEFSDRVNELANIFDPIVISINPSTKSSTSISVTPTSVSPLASTPTQTSFSFNKIAVFSTVALFFIGLLTFFFLKTTIDKTPPKIAIEGIEEDKTKTIQKDNYVALIEVTDTVSGIKQVLVNGDEVFTRPLDGKWKIQARAEFTELKPIPQIVRICAIDFADNQKEFVFVLHYQPENVIHDPPKTTIVTPVEPPKTTIVTPVEPPKTTIVTPVEPPKTTIVTPVEAQKNEYGYYEKIFYFENDIKIDMIWIPNSDQDILPTKENANKGFWISKYEISNIQYITYLKANKITSDIFSSTNMPQGYLTQEKYYSYPVVYISWNHAYNFAKWLLKSVKKDNYIGTQTTIRLPTLKEINKVAGDNPNSFPWGTSNDSEIEAAKHANFFSKRDGYNFTAPVDQYKIGSSKYGVYNIAGNVSEWLWDSDNIRQEQKKILNSSWRSRLECLKTCDELVIREEKPDFQNDEIGFRLVIIEE